MRSALRSVAVATSAVVALLGAPVAAGATERPERGLPGQDGAEQTRSRTSIGYDVSYPQCGTDLPDDRAFGIVGVNGGLSTRANPCLSDQLVWAHGSSGRVDDQPAAQLYLNTANPGQVLHLVTTWPTDGNTPYGACDGSNSQACSWQYGWERAENSARSFLRPAARSARLDSQPSRYTWWLDVETMNTWQMGSDDARDRNRATLEGMTAYLLSEDAEVGVYSTGYQWGRIVGEVPADSNLAELPSWLAGADDLDDARDTCDADPLVPGGRVTLVQYVEDDLDHNHACL